MPTSIPTTAARHTRTNVHSSYELSEVVNLTEGQYPVSSTDIPVPNTSPGNLPLMNQETEEDKKIN